MSKVHLSIKTTFGRPKGGCIRHVSLYKDVDDVECKQVRYIVTIKNFELIEKGIMYTIVTFLLWW